MKLMEDPPRECTDSVLNYLVVGNVCSGHDLLQAALSAHPDMVCHGDLFHEDEEVRRQAHESYFGKSEAVSGWYRPGYLSVEQYLTNKVFDRTERGEQSVGVRMDYSVFTENAIGEYIRHRWREGDFCLLHVTRNPVACFYEWQQQQHQMPCKSDDPLDRVFRSAGWLDPDKLVKFVRHHQASERIVNRVCDDRAVISYAELLQNPRSSLQGICEFLEVPFSPACVLNSKALPLTDLRRRIGNWKQLQLELPRDVRESLNTEEMY